MNVATNYFLPQGADSVVLSCFTCDVDARAGF